MSRKPSKHDHDRSEVWERADLSAAVGETMAAIGKNLRGIRVRKGYSQEQLAERAGLHAKHVQRLETGANNTTVASLVALAAGLEVKIEAFFRPPRSK